MEHQIHCKWSSALPTRGDADRVAGKAGCVGDAVGGGLQSRVWGIAVAARTRYRVPKVPTSPQ
jgi:hypothetical protein